MNLKCVVGIVAIVLIGAMFFPFPSLLLSAGQNTRYEGLEKNLFSSRENLLSASSAYFEENRGQFDEKVKYFGRGTRGYNLFLTPTEAVYVLSDPKPKTQSSEPQDSLNPRLKARDAQLAVAVFVRLVYGDQSVLAEGVEELQHRTNYFMGDDATTWRTGIRNYGQVKMKGVYDGIDMVWRGGANGREECDFHLRPNADPNQIVWEIEGAEGVEITTGGDLLIKTPYGEIERRKPSINRNGFALRKVTSRLKILPDKRLGIFRVGLERGEQESLESPTIEPSVTGSDLIYSTFLGGNDSDDGTGIAIDSSGNTYVAGSTRSIGFPTTAGVFDPTHNSNFDVFVSKLNPTGTNLIYSTFIGGNLNDECYGIALDSLGNAVVTGTTASTGYPTTAGAFDTTLSGGDVFVTKLNASGTQLIYSTLIGGVSGDTGYAISLGPSGDAFVVGSTASSDYPTTAGAFDTEYGGGDFDIFVSRLNASGTDLVYSTYLGGASFDQGRAIALDSSENAYVTGYTRSSNYPTTPAAFDTTHGGDFDVFVSKINPTGTQLVYSTFIGGSFSDQGFGIALDSSACAYVTGTTDSTNYPTTVGAFDPAPNGFDDVFVSKLNPVGTQLVYSTYLGGNDLDQARGIAVDLAGKAYVTGFAFSPGYPTTEGAFDTTHNGSADVFVSQLNASGSELQYSTFIGGNGPEEGRRIVTDPAGNAYVIGATAFSNYPTTPGAFDTTFNGESDSFVSKLSTVRRSAVPFDYDGDGKADISIFRPSNGEWHVRGSQGGFFGMRFGLGTDRIVPADYDGDGKTDIAVYRPSDGTWYVMNSSTGTVSYHVFGLAGDVPVPGDFDGDGRADISVFRPSDGTWYRLNSSDGSFFARQFGTGGDRPAMGDFDGDGKADLAVFRPSNGIWYQTRSSDDSFYAEQFGVGDDIIVPADYDGDGKTDLAVYRPSNGFWYIKRSQTADFFPFQFGAPGDIPAPGDFDGDGKADLSVFRPSDGIWYRMNSVDGSFFAFPFGTNGDRPTQSAFQ